MFKDCWTGVYSFTTRLLPPSPRTRVSLKCQSSQYTANKKSNMNVSSNMLTTMTLMTTTSTTTTMLTITTSVYVPAFVSAFDLTNVSIIGQMLDRRISRRLGVAILALNSQRRRNYIYWTLLHSRNSRNIYSKIVPSHFMIIISFTITIFWIKYTNNFFRLKDEEIVDMIEGSVI